MLTAQTLRRLVYLLIGIAVCLSAGSFAIETSWPEPGMVVEGIPEEAGPDHLLNLTFTLSYHNRFAVTQVRCVAPERNTDNAMLAWPSNEVEKLDFFSYSHIVWPRSETVVVKSTLRQMIYSIQTAREPLPHAVRFHIEVDGWKVPHSQNPVAFFTGMKPAPMLLRSKEFEVKIKR